MTVSLIKKYRSKNMLKKITFLLAAALLLMVNVCFATGNGEKQKLHPKTDGVAKSFVF